MRTGGRGVVGWAVCRLLLSAHLHALGQNMEPSESFCLEIVYTTHSRAPTSVTILWAESITNTITSETKDIHHPNMFSAMPLRLTPALPNLIYMPKLTASLGPMNGAM